MSDAPEWMRQAVEPVRTEDDFVAVLDRVGICLWKPYPGIVFPNLADAMDLAKPDDIWGTWFWKDDLHEAKRLYYGKLLAGRPTFVSMALLPAVIAARGDIDPYNLHEQGRLSVEAVRVYEALTARRELSTRELRRESGLATPDSKTAFENAVTHLGSLFQICKTGLTGRTRGTYSYRWGLVEDWVPDILAQAARLRPAEAAQSVASALRSVGIGLTPPQWKRLFGWDDEIVAAVPYLATRSPQAH